MSKPYLVIYNPTAGRGRVKTTWPLVAQALGRAGVPFEAVATTRPLEAVKLAAQACHAYRGVVSVGGDGTNHEIVNGLMQASAEAETLPLGIVPLGTGDDFAKVLPPQTAIGSQPAGWETAIAKIARGETRCYDVGRIRAAGQPNEQVGQAHYFINSMTLGFGALAAYHMTIVPRYIKGLAAYLAAIARTMIAYPTLDMQLQFDDETAFAKTSTISAVMNGRCFGNGFWIAPQAEADDGLLDVAVADAISRAMIVRMIPRLMKGTHIYEPVVKMYRARRVVVESQAALIVETDGEIPFVQARRLEVEVLPRRLRVIV